MKFIQSRALTKTWRIAAALLSVACILCTYALMVLPPLSSVTISPIIAILLATVFGLVAISGRAPV